MYHYLFKFLMMGDSEVGKSCIFLRFTEQTYSDKYEQTIGVEFGTQDLKQNDQTIKIQIWDTAGQEKFRPIIRQYYKGSIGIVLVFDITKKVTFQNVWKWYSEILEHIAENATIILVGNKIDLHAQRQVTTLEAKTFAEQYKMLYIETSAKVSENIELLFQTCSFDIYDKMNKRIIDIGREEGGIKMGIFYKQASQEDIQQMQQQEKQKYN